MEYAKLRPVQFFPVLVDGKRMGCLHDPRRISDKPLLIPWKFVVLLPHLDGAHSILDLQTEYTRRYGELLYREDLMDFLQKLDHYLFLDSERFHEFKGKIEQEFLRSPFRPPFFSGLSYPADPETLCRALEGYFLSEKGPGLPATEEGTKKVTGCIAPHIDITARGPCYAWAYAELARSPILPDLCIILGTCHVGLQGLFSVTAKTFQTPLGMVPCDEDFIKQLRVTYAGDLSAEESVHRSEHTIEFQVLFLKYLWDTYGSLWPPLRICPILCAFTPDMVSEGSPQRDTYRSFIDNLRMIIASCRKNTCVIASADLSHLGPKFGDARALGFYGKESCMRKDREVLNAIARQDQKGFQASMLLDYEERRICGYPALTLLLDILPPSEGTLLQYDQAVVDNQGSIVTFASMVFYGT